MQLRFIPVLMFVTFLLPACATLNKSECLTADWLTIGYEDGAQGYATDRIGLHRQACAEYGVSPDLNRYQEGYNRGIVSYCTPRNGFSRGRSGSPYTDICPAGAKSSFLQGYDAGKEVYLESVKSNELASDLRDISNRIENLDDIISAYENELMADSISKDKRREIRRTIKKLKEEHYYLRQDFEHIRDEKRDVDYNLNFLRRKYSVYE